MASQAPSPDCLNNDLCAFVYEKTGLGWLADTANYALVKPARILLIIVAALVLRYVIHRMIKRITRSAGAERRLGLFHPLRERMPASLQEVTRVRSERRKQRAEALGSVLQSIGSVTIFSIATMMVLSEFMLLEDQYGVGDVIDIGDVSGTVEAVGLRITTLRDARGVLWYIRNGEIIRVGNRSQGWAVVVVDVPVGFAGLEEATEVLNTAAATLATDPEFADLLLEAPQVLGVEQINLDGALVRTTVKTASEAQWRVARELRRRLTEALEAAGIAQHLSTGRIFVRPPQPRQDAPDPFDSGTGGPT